MNPAPWAVVLAGGDGTRVSDLTRAADGTPTPKQYCRFGGATPMVRWAIDRARRVVPRERVLVVVNQSHRRFWEPELADVPRRNVLVQPSNRGTGAGALLALLTLEGRTDPESPVLLLPSDHFVARETVMAYAMAAALFAARCGTRDVVLLGLNAFAADQDYGWILPAADGQVAAVGQFVEKPQSTALPGLIQRGALINSFVMAGRIRALVGMFDRSLPAFVAAFRERMRPPIGVSGLTGLYASIPVTDMSRQVLQPDPRRLSVVRVPPCGWSDLGTPARLQSYLSSLAVAA
jgi:mannose-1-phosphate guanylyltransferase